MKREDFRRKSFKVLLTIFIVVIILIGLGQINLRQWGIPFSTGGDIGKAYLFLLFIWLIITVINGKRIISRNSWSILLLIFLIWICISTYVNNNWDVSKEVFGLTLISAALFFVTEHTVKETGSSHWLVSALIVSGCVSVIRAIGNFYFLHKSFPGFFGHTRLLSPLGHPNFLGGFLLLTIPILISSIIGIPFSRTKIIRIGCLFVLLIGMIGTYSRTSWLGLLLALLFIVWKLYKKAFWYSLGVIIILLLTVIVLQPAKKTEANPVLVRAYSLIKFWGDENLKNRFYGWKGSMEIIRDNPLFGIGLGNKVFEPVYQQYKPEKATEELSHAHNLFLGWGVECGLPGLLLFLCLLGVISKRLSFLLRSHSDGYTHRYILGIVASFIGFMFYGLAEFPFASPRLAGIFWIIAGMVMASKRESSQSCT